ncbi:MAG: geranylgeranylglycerol-phosphate geranylgeranyltransferase [Candidatus Aenigmatarchaeota archaeon]
MLDYLRLIRPLNCIMSAIAVYIATVVSGLGLYPGVETAYAMLAVFFVCGAGMAVNDYFDIDADKINRPKRPLASGKIGKNTALLYAFFLFALGIFFSFMINRTTLIVAIIASLLLLLYAWKLKKVMLVGNIITSILVALTFLFGGFIKMNIASLLPLALLAFLSNLGREIYKSIDDIMGDKKANVATIAVKFGVMKAKLLASIFVIAAVALSVVPFVLGTLGFVYLFFAAIADMLFILSIVVPVRFSAKLCKIAMLVALIAFFVGAAAK